MAEEKSSTGYWETEFNWISFIGAFWGFPPISKQKWIAMGMPSATEYKKFYSGAETAVQPTAKALELYKGVEEAGGIQAYVEAKKLESELIDKATYSQYRSAGGQMTFDAWKAAGKSAFPTAEELEAPPKGAGQSYYDEEGYLWVWDWDAGAGGEGGYVRGGYDPTKASAVAEAISPYQQQQIDLERQRLSQEKWRAEQGFEQEQSLQGQMLNWYRENAQMQADLERQQMLADLRANPQSWLEYASLAGQKPVVQPWMLPLSPQEYGFQMGKPIPGYSPKGTSMNLPELFPPSAQYMARLAPSMRQQYYGYERARTGQSPADVQWRQWSYAPPGGQQKDLTQIR